MNRNRVEQIMEYVKGSPENMNYGRWGALNPEQRKIIKELCNSWLILDEATNIQTKEIERLKKEEEIMKVDFREQDNGLILETSQKMFTKILDVQEQETIKAALKYCEENDLIPNIIDKDKLDMVLKLGIQALAEREINNGSN